MIPWFGVLEGVVGGGDMRPALGGAWVGYPIEKFQRKFRRGFTPYAALERFGVAQTEAAPVWEGGSLCGGPRECS